MELGSKILITGGSGLVGTALKNALQQKGYKNIYAIGSKDCDLTNYQDAIKFFTNIKPDYVFHMAAAVYGIMGNMENKGLSFLNNVLINTHVIEASRLAKVKKIVAMGSVVVYPYPPPALPLAEHMIWQGQPHESENSYGHAKRAMLAQLKAYQESYNMDFAFAISSNLYGPHDKYDIKYGHVVPSLIRKFYEAKMNNGTVQVWGDGSPARDFVYASDAADALLIIMDKVNGEINLASGEVSSIKEVVNCLAEHTHMQDRVFWDTSKPNGQGYRSYDLTKLFATGFKPKISLREGLNLTYDWYAANSATARK